MIFFIGCQDSGTIRDNRVTRTDTKAFCLSLVRKPTIKNDIGNGWHGWPALPRVKCGGTEPEITGISTVTSKEFETLAADYHRIPTTDFNDTEGTIWLNLTDHKTNFVHVRCDQDAWRIRSFWMLDTEKYHLSHLSLLHPRRCQLFTKISPDRRFMTWDCSKSVTSLIFENNVVISVPSFCPPFYHFFIGRRIVGGEGGLFLLSFPIKERRQM